MSESTRALPCQRARHHGVSVPVLAAAVLRSPGRALDAGTRAAMERRFGEDLGDIRLHTDAAAAQSAEALSARAYTVGRHIVFGPEGYAPQAPSGQQRLAHEVTHALQQRRPGGADLSTAQREGEARQAAHSVATGAPMPAISAASPAISRDPVPGAEDDASFQASIAEASCDIGALCRLSRRAPEVVSQTRLMRIYRACHPGVSTVALVGGNPCLTPNFGARTPPRSGPVGPGPRRSPGPTPATGGAPAPAAGGGLSLPSTTIAFSLGAAAVTIDLPASLAVRLPVPFRGAERVVFSLNASPSEFSFSVTVNAVPHVRIIARASMTTEGRGAAGLTVQTTRTVCRAVDPAAARSALQAAGTRLRDAIQAVQTPPPPDPEASELSRSVAPQARYAEVIAAMANVHSEIERVGAPCREVPVAEVEFGAQGQLTTPDTPPTPGSLPPASFIGGSLRFRF
ncbi:DUF4157 domain-containing protein [Zoogloeaceae bacterium G21618-S1]|nr:DUF4157 domain-containing protein [Zoogloeaceae bacterium G21618-S1]